MTSAQPGDEKTWVEDHETSCRLIVDGVGLDPEMRRRAAGLPEVAAVILPPDESVDLFAFGYKALIRRDAIPPVHGHGLECDWQQIGPELRKAVGPSFLIGARCGLSRHAAMVAGEVGADYVLFGDPDSPARPLCDLAEWWSGLFVLPCAIRGHLEEADVARLAEIGAGFVQVDASYVAEPSLARLQALAAIVA